MRLLAIGLLATTLSSQATIFTIDSLSDTHMEVTVDWGPGPLVYNPGAAVVDTGPIINGKGYFNPYVGFLSSTGNAGLRIFAGDFPWGVPATEIDLTFPDPNNPLFSTAFLHFTSSPTEPGSYGPTPDGYGIHMVFDANDPAPAPDAGASGALAGLGLGVLVLAARRFAA